MTDTGKDDEVALTGGNVAEGVVRVGATVRKPATPATPAVEALLDHLHRVGFSGAPRSLGTDDRGRHVLEHVEGDMADTLPPMTEPDLARVGALIRQLHDVAAAFVPPRDAAWQVEIPADRHELVCHHDLAPWNLVVAADRWVFIDWDGAGPGSRLWDLAYAAHGFVPLHAGGDPARDGRRLRALVDGYGLDDAQRRRLPALVERHTRAMYDLLADGARTGRQPWARLYAEGHGDHWRGAADHVAAHVDVLVAALLAPPRGSGTLSGRRAGAARAR